MAEFVEKRCQDVIPVLEQMERIKLFDENEIRNIAKKIKDYEYKIQRHTKRKEDYLGYIQYEMNLLKLINQRRDKFGNTQKKSDIDFAIRSKMNNLYKEVISTFQDDIRFWIAYMKFCKHSHFHSNISHMLGRMLQVHRDKPKCWHIAACWELEENDDKLSARHYFLRGLHIHPDSELLYIAAFKLELDMHLATASTNAENAESQEDNSASVMMNDTKMPLSLQAAYLIYQQAFDRVKDIKFIVQLLNIVKDYNDTEKLQKNMICDMIREYTHEPLMWDTMARRELQGLVQPVLGDTPMELDNAEHTSLRDRITCCNQVYQTAVKKIKTEATWTLYIDCLWEINRDERSLPNFTGKLLKAALMQAHRAKKLNEGHYLSWIEMLISEIQRGTKKRRKSVEILNDNKKHDEDARKKLDEVLCGAIEALPNSVRIWHAWISYLLQCGQEKEAYALYPKVTEILGEKALPLWKMRILHAQIRSSGEVEESFRAALKYPLIARDISSAWLEWLVLTKEIRAARKEYKNLCQQPHTTLEFHKKMAMLELVQPEASPKYMRRPYEMALLNFGTNDTSIWMDYIKHELKHGDPKHVGVIHARAVKTLDPSLTSSFVEEYTIIAAKPDSI